MNKTTITFVCFFLFWLCSSIALASPATEAPTALKGYAGESFVEDICLETGRKLIPYKVDPNVHGPDKIFILPDGTLEVHEVKAYSNWPGPAAMKTTANGMDTYELSYRWCRNWIDKTLSSPTSTDVEKRAARMLAEAIKNDKIRYVYDEINLATEEFRRSIVRQIGEDGIELSNMTDPIKIKQFEEAFLKKRDAFMKMKLKELENIMGSPRLSSYQLLSKEDRLKLLQQDKYAEAGGKEIDICSGVMTSDGRLLVSIKTGASAGLMVFAADAGHSVYKYIRGDILKPELEREIEDAAVKGAFVGTCVGVTVFLGATPSGWCVLGVSIGSYMIVDTALKFWHEYQDSKHLTIDDLRGWGLTMDTPLAPTKDTILKPETDTPLKPRQDTILRW